MVKALFFDLDGTLLNGSKAISQRTRSALETCRANGVRLFPATARPPLLDRMLGWDESLLSLFHGGVYCNGGCVKIGESKEYAPVADDVVRDVMKHVCRAHNLNIALQLEGEKHAFRFPLSESGYKSWGVTAEEALTPERANHLKTIKILVFYSDLVDSAVPIDRELAAGLMEDCTGRAQFYLTDQGKCIQIMGASVNKVKGIEKIRGRLGLDQNEIAVFGDDTNDLEMLSEYEFGIAMGNADGHVKAAAKYVTEDNDSDGVEYAIRNILHLI